MVGFATKSELSAAFTRRISIRHSVCRRGSIDRAGDAGHRAPGHGADNVARHEQSRTAKYMYLTAVAVAPYPHDGRASSFESAISEHDGDASACVAQAGGVGD